MRYSNDKLFKSKLDSGMNIDKIATEINVAVKTLKQWRKKLNEGTLYIEIHKGGKPRTYNYDNLKEYIHENSDKYLREKDLFNDKASISGIHKALKKLNIKFKKKTLLYREKDDKKRLEFTREIEELEKNDNIIIYQDECGIQEDIVREYGRIGKDENNKQKRLYGLKTGTKHKKTGVISGYAKLPDKDKFLYIGPMIYIGNCDTILFNEWLNKILILDIKLLQKTYNRHIVLVLDNVSYHKSEETMKICEENNISLKFQPPYSPDLNKIEHSWNTTKDYIRKETYTETKTFINKLCDILCSMSFNPSFTYC